MTDPTNSILKWASIVIGGAAIAFLVLYGAAVLARFPG